MEESNNSKMVRLLRRIKPEMHGAVVEDMERRGVRYGLNYGVSVPVVRKEARAFAPDHKLAEYLYLQDVRELKLAAVYVDDPSCVTAGQMDRWADGMPADELMEHAAMNLFYASPDADTVINNWLGSDDLRRIKGALYMSGQRAMRKLGDPASLERSLSVVRSVLAGSVQLPQQSAIYFFCRMAEYSEELRNGVMEVVSIMREDSRSEVVELGDEIAAFIEFV